MNVQHFCDFLKKLISDSAADYTATLKQGKPDTNYPFIGGIVNGFETLVSSMDRIHDDYKKQFGEPNTDDVPVAQNGKK